MQSTRFIPPLTKFRSKFVYDSPTPTGNKKIRYRTLSASAKKDLSQDTPVDLVLDLVKSNIPALYLLLCSQSTTTSLSGLVPSVNLSSMLAPPCPFDTKFIFALWWKKKFNKKPESPRKNILENYFTRRRSNDMFFPPAIMFPIKKRKLTPV